MAEVPELAGLARKQGQNIAEVPELAGLARKQGQNMAGNYRKGYELEYVHQERRYDLCTSDGAGNRSDFSDQGQRP